MKLRSMEVSVYDDTSLLFHHWYIMSILSILVHIQGHGGVSLTHLAISFNGFIVVSFCAHFSNFQINLIIKLEKSRKEHRFNPWH